MISIIIVDYKSSEATFDYIKKLNSIAFRDEETDYIVVDNSEMSHVINYIKNMNIDHKQCEKNYEGIKYKAIYKVNFGKIKNLYVVDSGINLGYAQGNNLGAQFSRVLTQNPYLIFSNNDIIIKNKFPFNNWKNIFEQDNIIAAIGPDIRDLDNIRQNPHNNQSIWKTITFRYLGLLFSKKLLDSLIDIPKEDISGYTDWLAGSFFMVDSEKFAQIGGFDPYTFLYGEERILAHRYKEYGLKMYYSNDFQIIHNHSQVVKSNLSVLRALNFCFDSQYYYFSKLCKSTWFELFCARVSFDSYKILYRIKCQIKNILKK